MKSSANLYKYLASPALLTTILLLIPWIAMQFTNEVVWNLTDFITAGALLFGTGFTYKLVTLKADSVVYRVAASFALAAGLFLIWANLAVGIIGSEAKPINLLYFGVVFVGIIGAIICRFQAEGMALTMFTVAFAQALVAIIALAGGFYQSPPSSIIEILSVNGFFVTLFVASALLFRYADVQD